MRKSHNIAYLKGATNIDDERYRELMAEDGIEIPEEDLWSPRVNASYIAEDPEFRAPYVQKKLAAAGLMEETTHE